MIVKVRKQICHHAAKCLFNVLSNINIIGIITNSVTFADKLHQSKLESNADFKLIFTLQLLKNKLYNKKLVQL